MSPAPDGRAVRSSQRDKILAALQAGDELTFMSALERFGCSRIAARVHSLKAEGHPIVTRMIEVQKPGGLVVTVAAYRLAAADPAAGPASAAAPGEVA